ncbi:MAG: hypothetical protein AAFR61_14480 [Bacteroidota bacterium]
MKRSFLSLWATLGLVSAMWAQKAPALEVYLTAEDENGSFSQYLTSEEEKMLLERTRNKSSDLSAASETAKISAIAKGLELQLARLDQQLALLEASGDHLQARRVEAIHQIQQLRKEENFHYQENQLLLHQAEVLSEEEEESVRINREAMQELEEKIGHLEKEIAQMDSLLDEQNERLNLLAEQRMEQEEVLEACRFIEAVKSPAGQP